MIDEKEKETAIAVSELARELIKIADGNLFTVNNYFPTGWKMFASGFYFTMGVFCSLSLLAAILKASRMIGL